MVAFAQLVFDQIQALVIVLSNVQQVNLPIFPFSDGATSCRCSHYPGTNSIEAIATKNRSNWTL